MRLRASLHSNQDQPPPVYLNIRLWAQPSTEPCACKGPRLPLPALGAHALSRALAVPRGLALPVRAPVARRRPRLVDVVPSVPLVLPPQLSKAVGPHRCSEYDQFSKNKNTGIDIYVKYDDHYRIP